MSMDQLYQRVLSCFPQAALTPQPDFTAPPFVSDYNHIPLDYQCWIKEIGSGKMGDTLEIFQTLSSAEHFIPDAKHCGVDNVIIWGRFAHGYVGFSTAFETWYVVVIVGDMNLCTAPKPKLSFSGYLDMLTQSHSQNHDGEDALWQRISEWNLAYTIISGLLVLVAIIWGLYLLGLM